MSKDYPLRYQATILIEAKTPLAVGSGDKDLLLDNPIIRDAFDLPYIPATGLAGVLRHAFKDFGTKDEETINCLFGYQEEKSETGKGSRLILSSAHLFAGKNKVADGLENAQELQEELQKTLLFLQRDHARINHKGVADKEGYGKFESQLLARGTRFVFEMELWGNQADQTHWETLLRLLAHPFFRIGGGTRKGFGELEVNTCWHRTLDLREQEDLAKYLAKTTQITLPVLDGYSKFEYSDKDKQASNFVHYQLEINPRDFFLFDGQFDIAVFEDKTLMNDVKNQKIKLPDMTPKTEQCVTWDSNDNPQLSEYKWLIPATSVKGAIAHRVAFYYNKAAGNYAQPKTKIIAEMENYLQNTPPPTTPEEAKDQKDQINKYLAMLNGDFEKFVGIENAAVLALFGREAAEDKETKEQLGRRGKVIISDVYVPKAKTEKVLNHVKIDRFTGGAIDTALFSEKVAHTKEKFVLDIFVEASALEDEKIKEAFKQTLKDLVNEQLPLGGGVMRGHGMMRGTLKTIKEN